MAFFTVVIPLYNKENFIGRTLNSVLEQTYTDFKVIIVNDASTDNSLTVAQGYNDERIAIINHDINKGLSASRNTGIKNANTEYIAFLDADDIWKPQFLKKIYSLIQLYPQASLFATKYEENYPGNVTIDLKIPDLQLQDNHGIVAYFENDLKKPLLSFSSICIKKEVFNKAGYFDESITFGEDIDFYIRANYTFDLAYYNESHAVYFIHSTDQITQSGLKGKKVPDFDKYETLTKNRPDIKKYLDFHRYAMAKRYKLSGNSKGYNKMVKGLNLANLNYKQKFLLYAPVFILKFIKSLKVLLTKKGINPTTY